jgi:hypothetical protein
MNKTVTKGLAAVLLLAMVTTSIQAASAATLFSVVLSSEDVNQTGWFAGYVAYGSGTYTLSISASGSQNTFPITNIKVIVCVSDEAAAGGVQSITIESTPISDYTQGVPQYYGANGGPFSESDYYGYNDNFVIPQLTYSEAHHPENAKNIAITIQFSSTATPNSKVMFLCYGINAQGQGLKTAFSNGSLIIPTPEYGLGSLVAFTVCISAFLVVKKSGALSHWS